MSDLNEWISERRRIHEAATEGPWAVDGPAQAGPDDSLIVYPKNDAGAIAYVQPAWDDADSIVDGHNTLPTALTMIEKVLERHRPVRGETRRSPDVCAECDELIGEPGYDCGGVVDWPCPTVQDLSSAIEGATNE